MITNSSKQAIKDSIEQAQARLKLLKAQCNKHEAEFYRLSVHIVRLEQSIDAMKADIK
jgi:peptidoglycan hydrolase CwlO-like protein